MNEQEAINILKCAIKKPNTEDGYLGQSIHMAISALEKQIPMKVNEDDCCPICHTYGKDDNDVEGDYCPNCGQKLDWSE